ncbi:MAG: IS1634 family transposase [Desulfomonilaceae bacterium]
MQIVQSVRKGASVSQKIVRHIGIAFDDDELEKLLSLAESIKLKLEAQQQMFLISPEELTRMKQEVKSNCSKITKEDYQVDIRNLDEEQRVISGIHDVYGKLFHDMGYDRVIKNPARNKAGVRMFENIVLARIANPSSKRTSVQMLEENFGISLNLENVYRMMDKLDDQAIERLKKISYMNTKRLYMEKVDVVFYDCTTLYFEAFEEDELREKGFSKDHKFNEVQVLLALMVTKEGLPVGYNLYEGGKYEGHTLIPALKELKEKYEIDRVVFVADAGMLSKDNLKEMEGEKLEYIVGARLKNLPLKLQKQILNQDNYKEISEGFKVARFDYRGRKLIMSYSARRARKDAHDREKALEKLEKKLSGKKNVKEYLNNCGYKKFLKIEGDTQVGINQSKIDADQKWDGLRGIMTNAVDLSDEEAIQQYGNLWQVEEAFRVTKHDLKVRPVYHWKPRRVKAHIAIAYTAYSLVKYLEYRVKLQYIKLSPEEIKRNLIEVQTSILYDKTKKIRYGLPSRMSKHASKIYDIFDIMRNCTPYIIEKV